ncbi:putative 60S ribosomal protein L4/L1/L2 [Mycena venus]|uniref:Putative 60S ribosomal protein L4/L1/L2 n=1 Tax=Mycena venus TaxID=2733690 RepID=A0A8H7CQ23_9AGAR|nr:putative 60S ribosomal protein L4/L1/L2 [Mycena venus]
MSAKPHKPAGLPVRYELPSSLFMVMMTTVIEQIEEVSLVITNAAESFTKTKEAVTLSESLNAYADIVKCRGSLIVYNENNGIVKAFHNLAGVELVNVCGPNLLQLAPGGHLSRFIIYTDGTFGLPDEVFGTFDKMSTHKRDYLLSTSKISNPDVTYLVNSNEIQSVIRPAG